MPSVKREKNDFPSAFVYLMKIERQVDHKRLIEKIRGTHEPRFQKPKSKFP